MAENDWPRLIDLATRFNLLFNREGQLIALNPKRFCTFINNISTIGLKTESNFFPTPLSITSILKGYFLKKSIFGRGASAIDTGTTVVICK